LQTYFPTLNTMDRNIECYWGYEQHGLFESKL
jgi:hypothetical protein